ncbi:MAG: ABC transporter substrate-binding protein, partial [Burkholderiales bacterium]
MSVLRRCTLCVASCTVLGACGDSPWNNPYHAEEAKNNTLYSAFEERPKYLDPARSYSSNEYLFIAQIYEPPLQYHFLKRPYQLVPLAAAATPTVRYFDDAGKTLTADAAGVTYSEYVVDIRPGMLYQPHPALARDKTGRYRYHALSAEDLEGVHTLADFAERGTREVVAEDYVYQIKRLANPKNHSPIGGLMQGYIVGFGEFSERLERAYGAIESSSATYLDLRRYAMPGAVVLDRYRYKLRIKGKYPQFIYWLAMPFFAPMPWEAERFYLQTGMEQRNITLNWFPLGSGPFMLTENNPNLRMVLERNPNFHEEHYPSEGMQGELNPEADAGNRLPLIDRAVFSLEKEDIPYWNKFLQGYYDSSGIGSDSFDQAIQFDQGAAEVTDSMRAKGIKLETAVSTSVLYMGFNMRGPLVGGLSERARKLRRAISIAVDFEEFISIFTNGRGLIAQGPIPPG